MMALLAQEDLLLIFSHYQSDPTSPILTEDNFISFLAEMQREKGGEVEKSLEYVRRMKEPFRITRETAKKEEQVRDDSSCSVLTQK